MHKTINIIKLKLKQLYESKYFTTICISAYIVICIIIVIGIIYVFKLHEKYSNTFADITNSADPTTTAASVSVNDKMYGAGGAPEMSDKQKGCNAMADMVGICLDYNNCCNGESAKPNNCYCQTPFILNCKSKYDECMAEPTNKKNNTPEQLIELCAAKNKDCCIPYNKINIDTEQYTAPVNLEQSSNKMCTLSSVEHQDSKCPELCQAYPNCAAYTISRYNCDLYSTPTPDKAKIDAYTKKPIPGNPQIKYYMKKIFAKQTISK